VIILSLDPGLITGWALFSLQLGYHGALTLVDNGALESGVGYRDGYAGRTRCRQWLARELETLPPHDEAVTDRDMALYATCVPALGAFEAAHAWCDQHGLTTRGKRVIGEYPRKSGIATVERLTGRSVRVVRTFIGADGSEQTKPVAAVSVPAYRTAIRGLVTLPGDTKLHILDAVAIGLHHSHKTHGWRPVGWVEPKAARRSREVDGWMEALRR
jgi:hypothetical protein